MPTYVYECEKCGEFEQQQSIKEPALTRCPKCGKNVRRIVAGSTSFILKGDGWCKSSCLDGSCCMPSSSRRRR
ncbi:MAG: zinc ribbon domain-containing protein [Deltaproteobacteria bacterium]|nr:zinc ribbon domain-containing protein [Deltaproteobacteria bacterium]